MTGETLYGRSISVISRLLPTNWNLAMAQAATTPNTVLIGTTISGDQQRQADGRQGVGDRRATGRTTAQPLLERLGEHRHQRHHQEQRRESRA